MGLILGGAVVTGGAASASEAGVVDGVSRRPYDPDGRLTSFALGR